MNADALDHGRWSPWLTEDVEIPAFTAAAGVEAGARPVARRHAPAVMGFTAAREAGDWEVAALAWGRYLEEGERAAIVDAVMRAAGRDEAGELAEAVHEASSAGQPLPPFANFRSEARCWIEWASETERKIYLIAIFRSLSSSVRVRALGAMQRFALR